MDEVKRVRPFGYPPEPTEHLVVDSQVMNQIRDVAHELYMEKRSPNANLIMLEALKRVMVKAGAKANFSIVMEDK